MSADTAKIPLYDRYGSVCAYSLIDAADAEWANRWRWRRASQEGAYAYRSDKIDGKAVTVALHRALLGLTPGDGMVGDHINRDRLDNRRSNLRVVTPAANAQNVPTKRGASSPYRGVSWSTKDRRWTAAIRLNGKVKMLGRFADEMEAARVAYEARREHMPYATD